MPRDFADPKRDPNSDNYPYMTIVFKGSSVLLWRIPQIILLLHNIGTEDLLGITHRSNRYSNPHNCSISIGACRITVRTIPSGFCGTYSRMLFSTVYVTNASQVEFLGMNHVGAFLLGSAVTYGSRPEGVVRVLAKGLEGVEEFGTAGVRV